MTVLRRRGWAVKCARSLEVAIPRQLTESETDWNTVPWLSELKQICNELYSFEGGRPDKCIYWEGKLQKNDDVDDDKDGSGDEDGPQCEQLPHRSVLKDLFNKGENKDQQTEPTFDDRSEGKKGSLKLGM